jgi:hypothetical protein
MLIVDGLMIRTVRVSELECCELVGPGDVIRPWDADDDLAPLATGVSWRVLEETRVAVLDDAFTQLACRWPGVVGASWSARCAAAARSRCSWPSRRRVTRTSARWRHDREGGPT